MNNYKTSSAGKNLLKLSEILKLKPYLCPAGVPTIGWGCTYYENGIHVNLKDAAITRDRAEELLANVLVKYENAVNRYVQVPINQNQFDALVDFTFNNGMENFRTSTLLRKLNAKDYAGAQAEFKRWIYADGKKMNGLVTRRAAEERLFATKP